MTICVIRIDPVPASLSEYAVRVTLISSRDIQICLILHKILSHLRPHAGMLLLQVLEGRNALTH